MDNPTISIITVAYNAAETISETIDSVANQSYQQIEYIVLDGGSTDGTVDIIQSKRHLLSYWHSKADKGMYDALNRGIELAKGEYIAILNADDVYASREVISEVVHAFVQQGVDSVYGDLMYVDRFDISLIKRHWVSGEYRPGDFLYGWMPPHPSFFLKKSCYESYGVFNTQLQSAADYELMLRMIHVHQIGLSYIPKVFVLMRDGGMSNLGFWNRLRGNKEDRIAWKINRIKPKWYSLYLKPLRKLRQFLPKKRRFI